MEAPGSSGSAGPVVDGRRQTVAQPPSLVLGSKTRGGGLGRSSRGVCFLVGKKSFPVLMLHKLEDVSF